MSYPFRDLRAALPTRPDVPYWRTRRPHEIHDLVVHHTAGPADQSPAQINRIHQQRDWGPGHGAAPVYAPRITYHYGVSAAGVQWKFNATADVTWHCPGKNRSGLSIVLFGDLSRQEVPLDQYRSFLELAARILIAQRTIRLDRVWRHGDIVATQCPGRYFPETARVRADLAAALGRAPR